MCLNIINEDNRRAVGLAKPLPNRTNQCQLRKYIPSTLHTGNIWRRPMNSLENGGILIALGLM
jgi:hypothetical protein